MSVQLCAKCMNNKTNMSCSLFGWNWKQEASEASALKGSVTWTKLRRPCFLARKPQHNPACVVSRRSDTQHSGSHITAEVMTVLKNKLYLRDVIAVSEKLSSALKRSPCASAEPPLRVRSVEPACWATRNGERVVRLRPSKQKPRSRWIFLL